MNWLSLFIGVLVGWLIEWLIDLFYWRRKWQASSASADAGQQELEAAQLQNRELTAQLECYQQQATDLEAAHVENRELSIQLEQQQRQIAALQARLIALSERPNDLTRIEGIGPKISEVLNQHGITTFAELADTRADTLREILERFGDRFQLADPTTWPEQARLAARNEWEQLRELQDNLLGGRRPQAR